MSSSPVPEHLVAERYAELAACCRAAGVVMHDDAGVGERVRRLLLASDFAFEALRADPALLTAAGLERLRDPAHASVRAGALARAGGDVMAALRRFRRAEAVRLVFRDVNGLDEVTDTLAGTTDLYETLIAHALRHAERSARARHGTPRNAGGVPQALVVFALGKLGGGELNFSSDVDLVLAYPEAGATDGARPLDNAEFFTRVAREFVRLLAEATPDGVAARVDLRLRPFGDSGPVVASFAAMEQYYQREGRDWERYAWIKARPVAGDVAAGNRLLETLRPFVFRRYFDYTALAGLRDMKTLIDGEVARRDLVDDLKLGAGGIREIEFTVQLQQLIRGGRDASLRARGLLPALSACAVRGYVSQLRARELREAYLFLRQLENRVQMFGDRQIHALPSDPVTRERIARTLGHADWQALSAALNRQRGKVTAIFADVLRPEAAAEPSEGEKPAAGEGAWLWQRAREDRLENPMLVAAGFTPAEPCLDALRQIAALHGMSARGARRIEHLMPELIDAAASTSSPADALVRLCRLVQAVARRSAYLALLQEQPAARARVAALCAESAFLAERVITQPLLLDDVLAPRVEHLARSAADLRTELARQLAAVQAGGDAEAVLAAIAEWRGSYRMRIGLAFRDGAMDAVVTARALAGVADAVVGAVLEQAERELVLQHGRVPGDGSGIAVLGYGSLGGAELGFDSDLDLVFVYDAARGEQTSDGARPLAGARWYARLAQRVVHWLSAPTRGGQLYEVDTRLRPDGGKSLLVASLDAFFAYQRERAWTWEQQALVRARAVGGDIALGSGFARERGEVLCEPRDRAQVIADVCRMRAEWRKQRDRSDGGSLDLKQGAGALLDIQFLLQGLVLLHAHAQPALAAYSDTPRLITASADAGVLPADDADALTTAHAELLERALSATLAGERRVVPRDLVLDARCAKVLEIARRAGFEFGAG
ncbi:MAG: glutamine synthetase adenylyl-L-tyrosine phosphorylase/glutamate-ammonia-ligase adenylyltransferase [Rhodanobacteraceae bacterium]|jgi:glutamate-ammonia-ligase adenylyltransferase|nr:MAG: glutamine synthetase adenylyl-L-tyrosine phosphorylase/glutamate-ammonia-ligase adenylyltransferase [Rhodanobacteraceae bacterium]